MIKVTYIISDIDKALAFEWIADCIDQSKVQLTFILILQEPAALEGFLNSRGIACTTYYYTTKKQLPGILWKVVRQLKNLKPDAVHCHLLIGSLVGLTAAFIAGIKKRIYTRHHSDYHHRYFPKGIKWDRLCNRLATSIIAPSGAVKEVLLTYEKVKPGKVTVIHHGFDLTYFTEVQEKRVQVLRNKFNINGQAPVVGVIARFTELKGIQFIIPAFRRLLQKYPDALLLLFNARGDYAAELQQQLQAIPADNYRQIPFETDLAAVYQLFDVFIQASTDRTIEAFGQTYVEALASGVPSVFTLSGIAPDFITHEENALVVPFKNADAIYEAVLELMANKELREKLINNGRMSVQEKFNLNLMIQKLEKLYAG